MTDWNHKQNFLGSRMTITFILDRLLCPDIVQFHKRVLDLKYFYGHFQAR